MTYDAARFKRPLAGLSAGRGETESCDSIDARSRRLCRRRPHGENASRLRQWTRRRRRGQRQRRRHGIAVPDHQAAKPLVETVRRLAQKLRVIVELPEPDIAFAAK